MAFVKSILLVTVDCLRADRCGFMGCPRPITPFLDGLAAESFVVPNAIAAGVPTYYSLPAIMASRYPLAMGREVVGLAAGEKNLAEVFKESGYSTAFFGAGNPYISARFGYDQGFDTFRDFLDDSLSPSSTPAGEPKSAWVGSLNRMLTNVTRKTPGIRGAYDELYFQYCQRQASANCSLDSLRRFPTADVIVDQARNWLASVGNDPFFLWLHFMDPHSPYYPTEKGLELAGAKALTASRARYLNTYWNRYEIGSKRLRRYRDEIIELYEAGIRWVDAQLLRLIDSLRRFKRWEDCIFAVTADHGEQFLEHEGRYHAPSLGEELIHVPLLLRIPSVKKKAVSDQPLSHLHLAPTLLAACGLPVPKEFQGQSLWQQLQQGTAWSEPAISECVAACMSPFDAEQRRGSRLLSVRETQYKLVLNFETGTEQLLDLEKDPEERCPLPNTAARPERRRLFESALAHLRRANDRQTSEYYLRTRARDVGMNFAQSAEIASRGAVA
jgi:arylsulfatase A-like enzyme